MNPLSHDEIERMRQIVQQHDSQRKPIQIVDLNNPPKEPYRFQKFPKMVYDLTHSEPGHVVNRIVRSEDDLEAALAQGWSESAPAYSDERIEPLSPVYAAQAQRVDEQLAAGRPGRPGRPRHNVEVA